MKTSARNQFLGRICAIQTGPINAEVEIDLNGKDKITAVINHESVAELGLAEGSHACAVFKASSVIIGVSA